MMPRNPISVRLGRVLIFTAMSSILTAVVSQPVLADNDGPATGVVKQRRDLMEDTGKNMKAIKRMIQGSEPFNADKLAFHAANIEKASTYIPTLFPKGSLQRLSEAKPRIWQDWKRFTSDAERLYYESGQLKGAAKSGDKRAIMQKFVAVGKACRSCHTNFREEDED